MIELKAESPGEDLPTYEPKQIMNVRMLLTSRGVSSLAPAVRE
jgi:hypothetical protein